MSRVIVFAGPSISSAEARGILDADCRPPAAQGDVYRACLSRPKAIGLIDGLFGGVPSVWHKEILWAMSHGIHVFGASSMGALRAAELHGYGMVGVGSIFEAYRNGSLEEDDEVAVTHGPAEAGFPACSVAMVNIRETLQAAEIATVVGSELGGKLRRAAKNLHFVDRNWPRIIADVGIDASLEELRAFQQWLPGGMVDRKRIDARAMLGLMDAWLREDPAPKRVSYSFAHTDKWEEMTRRVEQDMPEDVCGPLAASALLEELKLQGSGRFESVRRAALLRAIAEQDIRHRPPGTVGEPYIEETAIAFRRERKLTGRELFLTWMTQAALEPPELHAFFAREASLRLFVARSAGIGSAHLLDELRSEGTLSELAARAAEKRTVLQDRGLESLDPRSLNIGLDALLTWFVEEVHDGQHLPDWDAAARLFGFRDAEEILRAATREYCFRDQIKQQHRTS
jgi:hypothetical protein